MRVTADDGALGEQYLRDFQDNEKTIPTILTTSQKLSTGVDARNVRNIVLMRPINSMIEFKQIIGRGTRLFDGKDYFTIYDFVKAHQHFNDPEWDGEPIEPEPRGAAAPVREPPTPSTPRTSESTSRRAAETSVEDQAGRRQGAHHPAHDGHDVLDPDGTPMSAQQFIEMLFGELPEFFKDEDELRALWSDPDTRKLLRGLGGEGLRRRAARRDAAHDRCREERPFRRAGLRRLCVAAADTRGARSQARESQSIGTSTTSSEHSWTSF